MSFLLANLPITKVYVKSEYLYNLEQPSTTLIEGYWCTVKSKQGKALLFETLLPEYGALYDKLPISAFVWNKNYDRGNQLPLQMLQLWDCFSYHITILEKALLKGLTCEFKAKDKNWYKGQYLFTIDSCAPDSNLIDTTFSEVNAEHKSFNILKLENGQFAAQPNNRIRWYEQSLIPEQIKKCDFKVCDRDYTCETGEKWTVGDSDDFFYKSNVELIGENS